MKRICIYPKDIQQITGKSERQCRNIINSIRQKLNKEKYQLVTVQEFCEYMNINLTDLYQLLK